MLRLSRIGLLIFMVALGLLAGSWFQIRAQTEKKGNSGQAIDFSLANLQGEPVHLAKLKNNKAFVVVFLGTQCPVNNLFLARLNQLHREYSKQGVAFLGINSNVQDSPSQISQHAREHQITFPILRDHQNKVADLFGAKKTPEAFVLDGKRIIRYQGRIDDRFGIDVQKPAPSREDMVEALREVLAGKAVSIPRTEVAGCYIGRPAAPEKKGDLTFYRDIVPILQKNCQECHRPEQIGPMPLIDYDDVTAWGETIRDVIEDQRMPPWYADPRHGKFSNDRRLSPEQKNTLLAWIKQGMGKGNPKDAPPPRKFVEGWRIGEPDEVFTMPKEFSVPAKMPSGGVPYKYFTVETNFSEDKWVERAEAKAGVPGVVHHIIVFLVPPGENFFPGNPRTPVLAGTAPGDMPLILPTGMARKVPKGTKLVFQMHYTPNGKAVQDRSSIGLVFAKKTPTREVFTYPVTIPPLFLRIPAGAANHPVTSAKSFRKDCYVVGMMPHMHLRGKDFLVKANLPNGKTETLLSVPRFNFFWQSVYRPAQPVFLPKGTRLECVAHFDNSSGNPNNPDPSRIVLWGDQTWDEMMIGWVDVAYDIEKKR